MPHTCRVFVLIWRPGFRAVGATSCRHLSLRKFRSETKQQRKMMLESGSKISPKNFLAARATMKQPSIGTRVSELATKSASVAAEKRPCLTRHVLVAHFPSTTRQLPIRWTGKMHGLKEYTSSKVWRNQKGFRSASLG